MHAISPERQYMQTLHTSPSTPLKMYRNMAYEVYTRSVCKKMCVRPNVEVKKNAMRQLN